jgi:DNA primase
MKNLKDLKHTMNYKKILKNINIIQELEKRNIIGKISSNNLMCCCPFHREENPSCGIVIDGEKKGVYNCKACGESGNFFSLISHLDNISKNEARKLYENKLQSIPHIPQLKKKMLLKMKEKGKEEVKGKYLKKDILNRFKKPYGKYLKYLIEKRKLNKEIIEKFNILCDDDPDSIWYDRIAIPIFNENNKLLGITFRAIFECINDEKVRKIKGSEIHNTLFGIEKIKDKSVIIGVEGEIDMIYLQQYSIPAVQTGKFLSKSMIYILLGYESKFIYCVDGDVPYKNPDPLKEKDSVSYQLKKLRNYMEVDYIKLPGKKDPNDLSEKEVNKIFKRYIRSDL